jgi:hypothetical protein
MAERLLKPRKKKKHHPNSLIVIAPSNPNKSYCENKKSDLFQGRALK